MAIIRGEKMSQGNLLTINRAAKIVATKNGITGIAMTTGKRKRDTGGMTTGRENIAVTARRRRREEGRVGDIGTAMSIQIDHKWNR